MDIGHPHSNEFIREEFYMGLLLERIHIGGPLLGFITIVALILIMSVVANADSGEEDLFDEPFEEKKSKK